MRRTRSNAENEAPDDASRSPIPALPLNRTAKQRRAASPSPSSSADEDRPQSSASDHSFPNIDAAPSIGASSQPLGDESSEDEEDAPRIPAAVKGKGKAVAQDSDEEESDSGSDDEALAFLPDVGSVVYIAAEVAGCRTKGVKNGEVVDAEDDGFEYVGGFVLKEILGEGSYGRVYRARRTNDEEGDSDIAVKIAKSSSSIDKFMTEFELQTAARSPHVLATFACGRLSPRGAGGGCPFILMELARETLSHWMETHDEALREEDGIALPKAANFMRELIVGILHLHSCGIAHRDLKPDNLVIVEQGGVDVLKIIDFDSAVLVGPEYEEGFAQYMGSFPFSGADDNVARFLIPIYEFLYETDDGKEWFAELDDDRRLKFSGDWQNLNALYGRLRDRKQNPCRRDLPAYCMTLLVVLLGQHGFEPSYKELRPAVDGSTVEQTLREGLRVANLFETQFWDNFVKNRVVLPEFEENPIRMGYSTIPWLPDVLSLILAAYDDKEKTGAEKTQYDGRDCITAQILRLIAPDDPALAEFEAAIASPTTSRPRKTGSQPSHRVDLLSKSTTAPTRIGPARSKVRRKKALAISAHLSPSVPTVSLGPPSHLIPFIPSYPNTSADPSLPSASSSTVARAKAAAANYPCRTRQDVEDRLDELGRAEKVTEKERQNAMVVAYEVGSSGGKNRLHKRVNDRRFVLALVGHAKIGDGRLGGSFNPRGQLVGVSKARIEMYLCKVLKLEGATFQIYG